MEALESKLKSTFGQDFSEDYLSRILRVPEVTDVTEQQPDFSAHPAFSDAAEKIDFLIDERVISFFKIAPDQTNLALVLFNFSNEEVEVRWSPDFACNNIREIRHEELISLEDEELVFLVKPQQLQWVCFEKALQ